MSTIYLSIHACIYLSSCLSIYTSKGVNKYAQYPLPQHTSEPECHARDAAISPSNLGNPWSKHAKQRALRCSPARRGAPVCRELESWGLLLPGRRVAPFREGAELCGYGILGQKKGDHEKEAWSGPTDMSRGRATIGFVIKLFAAWLAVSRGKPTQKSSEPQHLAPSGSAWVRAQLQAHASKVEYEAR